MKKFSKAWKASKKRKKQHKYRACADKRTRKKIMSINLGKELRKKFKMRNIEPRKGDLVVIMKGKFKKKEGKIVEIKLKKYRIGIEGIQKTKKDGSKVNIYFDPSNLQIKELSLEDKKRLKIFEDKKT
ncbi:MAG: 50S ribosomal protein L24 [Candidatus Pacearchaeota archaeon]